MKARKVNQSTLDLITKHVDIEDVYVTHTIEQSDQSLDEIIEKRYPLVLCGGGDGTAMRIIEQMRLKVSKHNASGGNYQVPKFGLLKLGTGNGWAGITRMPNGVEPIWVIRQHTMDQLLFSKFNMMEAENRLFHFGGFGYDALVLNDYIDMKKNYTEGFKWKLANSLVGYLGTIFAKSIPKITIESFNLNVRVINESDQPVYKCSHSKGLEETDYKKGDTLYEGKCQASVFGTTSDYGFGLKVMPWAMTKKGYFQVRTSDVGAMIPLMNIKRLWQGKIEHPRIYDFLVTEARLEFEDESPFQLGGDPEGYRQSLHVKTSDFLPEVLDFRDMKD